MPIRVHAPDGSVVNFPDGTPTATINEAMAQVGRGAPSGNDFVGAGATADAPTRSVGSHVNGAVNALGQSIQDAALSTAHVAGAGGAAGGGIRLAAGVADAIRPGSGDFVRGVADQVDPVERGIASIPRYQPRGMAERQIQRYGGLVTNALFPASAPARIASVALPVAGGMIGRAVGGDPGEAIGELGASALGGHLQGFSIGRVRPTVPATTAETAARVLTQRGGRRAADAAAMRARALEFRNAGIEPTIVDTTTNSGRRTIRAVASGADGSQDTLRTFNEGRANDLPSRMSTQARAVMSPDPRTPGEIASEIASRRSAQADTQFGAVRGETLGLEPETVTALRSDYGRAAIREAAKRERDPETRAALNHLVDDALDNPGGTQITVGMADRISRVLLSQAEGAARAGDNDLASTLGDLGRSVRNPTRAAVPGYGEALDNFGAHSRLAGAGAVGEGFMARNTDEFVSDASRMTPEENEVARATARRAVERRSGENIGAAPGVARQLADAPEQQARNAALLGPEDAAQLQDRMRMEGRLVTNAADVNPRTGSQTQPNTANAERVQGAAEVGHAGASAFHGNPLPAISLWLRTRGVRPADAEALAQAVTDPAQHDAVIAAVDRSVGPGAGALLLQYIGRARLLGTAAVVSGGMTAEQSEASGQ